MKSCATICLIILVAVAAKSFGAEKSDLNPQTVIEIADATATPNHIRLSDYSQPSPSQRDNGNWFILYQHKPRYDIDRSGKRHRIYLADDCFWIDIDGQTKAAELVPCG